MSADPGTRLSAVNWILSRCGRGEVSALHTGTASDAANAERELDRASLSIQKIGWHFNTVTDKAISTDDNDKIPVPTGTIWIDTDAEDAHRNVSQHGSFMYDHDENRDTFPDDDSLKFRYVTLYNLECVPYPIREYIMATAAYNFVTQYGARMFAPSEMATLRGNLYNEMLQAKVDAKRFDSDTGNVNVLDTEHVAAIKGDRYRGRYGPGGRLSISL